MKKIVLLSDIHGHREVLSRIDALYPAADYYLHCGDSLVDADDLRPFASVKGNCDRADFPLYRRLAFLSPPHCAVVRAYYALCKTEV